MLIILLFVTVGKYETVNLSRLTTVNCFLFILRSMENCGTLVYNTRKKNGRFYLFIARLLKLITRARRRLFLLNSLSFVLLKINYFLDLNPRAVSHCNWAANTKHTEPGTVLHYFFSPYIPIQLNIYVQYYYHYTLHCSRMILLLFGRSV